MATETKDIHSTATPGDTAEPMVLFGVLAEFPDVESVMNAAKKVRAEGYKVWDVHSPFPLHGIDAIIGIRPTILPFLVLAAGLSGLSGALLLQWYCNAYDYPFMISGKPFFSLPANIPIIFEGTVLLSALTAVFGMLGLNRLPLLYNPLFKSARFRRVTNDKFFIWISASDPKFADGATAQYLIGIGAAATEQIEDSPMHEVDDDFPKLPPDAITELPTPRLPRPPFWMIALALIGLVGSWLPLAIIARARTQKSSEPRIQIMQDMGVQPRLREQDTYVVFADDRAMRLPIPGTVARDDDEQDDFYHHGFVRQNGTVQFETGFPPEITVNQTLLQRGQQRFNIYCIVCHGADGTGNGAVNTDALQLATNPREGMSWTPAANLTASTIRAQTNGKIFNTISNGIRTGMPSYAGQIPIHDRWAIIAYIRALQLSAGAPASMLSPQQTQQLNADTMGVKDSGSH